LARTVAEYTSELFVCCC